MEGYATNYKIGRGVAFPEGIVGRNETVTFFGVVLGSSQCFGSD